MTMTVGPEADHFIQTLGDSRSAPLNKSTAIVVHLV